MHRFFGRELRPTRDDAEADGIVDCGFWRGAGAAGLPGLTIPKENDGPRPDVSANMADTEASACASSSAGICLQSKFTIDYQVHHEPNKVIPAIAMSEPSAGSDLRGVRTAARRDGNASIIAGLQTYITNGQNADIVIVDATTGLGAGAPRRPDPGRERSGGSRLGPQPRHDRQSARTSQRFSEAERPPITDCRGEESRGCVDPLNRLPQSRLSLAGSAQEAEPRVFDEPLRPTKDCLAFGKAIGAFHNTRFTPATPQGEAPGRLSASELGDHAPVVKQLSAVDASAARLWHTELLREACDAGAAAARCTPHERSSARPPVAQDACGSRVYGGTGGRVKNECGKSAAARSGTRRPLYPD